LPPLYRATTSPATVPPDADTVNTLFHSKALIFERSVVSLSAQQFRHVGGELGLVHTETETHRWSVNVPDHPQRADSPEYTAAKNKMNEIAARSAQFCADQAKVDLLRQNAKRLYDLVAPQLSKNSAQHDSPPPKSGTSLPRASDFAAGGLSCNVVGAVA
jgi:hypothetical protein